MRYCKYCKKEKEDSEFYVTTRSKKCKKCSNKVSSERYYRFRETILEFERGKRLKLRGRDLPMLYVSINTPAIPVNEEKIEIEDEYCIEFGCGAKLTLQERLFGKKCISCQSNGLGIVKNAKFAYHGSQGSILSNTAL